MARLTTHRVGYDGGWDTTSKYESIYVSHIYKAKTSKRDPFCNTILQVLSMTNTTASISAAVKTAKNSVETPQLIAYVRDNSSSIHNTVVPIKEYRELITDSRGREIQDNI